MPPSSPRTPILSRSTSSFGGGRRAGRFPHRIFLFGMAMGAYLTRLSGTIFYTTDYLKEFNRLYESAVDEVSSLAAEIAGARFDIVEPEDDDHNDGKKEPPPEPTNESVKDGQDSKSNEIPDKATSSPLGGTFSNQIIPEGGITEGDVRSSLPDTRPSWDTSLPYPGWKPPASKAVVDFERQERVVLATKMHASNMAFMLEQMLCLLTKAYNDRMNYDIIIFTAEPWEEEAAQKVADIVAPAKISFVVDNPGFKPMVERLPEDIKKSFFDRCNITNYPENYEKLGWYTECRDIHTRGKSRINYNWQAGKISLAIH